MAEKVTIELQVTVKNHNSPKYFGNKLYLIEQKQSQYIELKYAAVEGQ